jgi:circadian clock protein KaiC
MSDNLILLRYAHGQGTVDRSLTVLKTRASRHEPDIREFAITQDGIHLAHRGHQNTSAQRN